MRDNRKKILCIEDDHETVELIAEELIDCGFDVQITYNDAEGLLPNPEVTSGRRVVRYQHARRIRLRRAKAARRSCAALWKYAFHFFDRTDEP
jgi:CheY-like chemotaxis protein